MTDGIFDTIVVGGGQTGLTAGYHLSRIGRTFLSEIEKLAAGMHYRSVVAAADCSAAGYLEKQGFLLRNGLLQRELEAQRPGG